MRLWRCDKSSCHEETLTWLDSGSRFVNEQLKVEQLWKQNINTLFLYKQDKTNQKKKKTDKVYARCFLVNEAPKTA